MNQSAQKTWIIEKSVGSLQSIVNVQKLPEDIKIDGDIIDLLERLSLVLCATKRGIETLEASVQFADQILEVNVTDNVPLITHLENM
ncbi:glutamyl-tRNA(Gln) amidotransferase subunit C, mitochondrial [Anoplophora glabripennis]|uniref:glutamyl-tRNA(Gln) amidotransferase subunit C, mitochondrial n=1 Tax=Anoplophora glabripennis TaxID=217634 RepID=UPI000873A801|nr:glutamyl-tRNA(Gln) amidotransferase subunit C, mitochondrial [Anoplophora glabripennis]